MINKNRKICHLQGSKKLKQKNNDEKHKLQGLRINILENGWKIVSYKKQTHHNESKFL